MRVMLHHLHLKLTLQSRRLDFTVLETTLPARESGSDSNWCAMADDLRTWLETEGDNLYLPDIQLVPKHPDSVTETRAAS